MRVFISWSGERSKYIAECLRSWLPKVIQAVDPWMSQEDIGSGMRWSSEIAGELEASKVGVICVTPENQINPWIMFEAGALSKTLDQTYVCPFLFAIAPSELSGPLSQFQAQVSTKQGTLKILKSLNTALGKESLEQGELDEIFEVWWPHLEKKIEKCPDYQGDTVSPRSTDDLLAEIVDNTREQLRREELRMQRSDAMDEKMESFTDFFDNMAKNDVPRLENASNIMNEFLGKLGVDHKVKAPLDSNSIQEMVESIRDIKDIDSEFMSAFLNPPQSNGG